MSYVDRTPTNSAFNEFRDKTQRITVNTSQRWGTYNSQANMKNLFASATESFNNSLSESVFLAKENSDGKIEETPVNEQPKIENDLNSLSDGFNRSSSRVQAQEKAEIRRKWQNLIHSASRLTCKFIFSSFFILFLIQFSLFFCFFLSWSYQRNSQGGSKSSF